jgi:hydroxymethylbilane synthase
VSETRSTGSEASPRALRLGSRKSALARWQSDHIAARLRELWPGCEIEVVYFTTKGDRVLDRALPAIGGKGLFTAELEAALLEGRIDLAVHSLKDLPTDDPKGLTVGAIPRRAAFADVLVSRSGMGLAGLPEGGCVGTSSVRRGAQILRARPDLRLADIRGNVDTRLRKALDPKGPYDAIVLAEAGLARLGLEARITERFERQVMLPAPGQGALGVQCRDAPEVKAWLAPLEDRVTRACVTAERAFLGTLGGGCSVPVAALAQAVDGGGLCLATRVLATDGTRMIETAGEADMAEAVELGTWLAAEARAAGADALLAADRP